MAVMQVEAEMPENRGLDSQKMRYPLSLSQLSCVRLAFPDCLLREDLARTSFPYSLYSERVGETEWLSEAAGFLLTLKNRANLYYVLPQPN